MLADTSISSQIAVFLGPSLPRKQATALLKANYYPPVQKGDIYRIIPSGVKTIIIIDGIFQNNFAVWHREILSAIEEGIQVIGCSGMGALRAAELEQFGMAGYGTVFELYRDGVIEGDDEVALLHGSEDAGFTPMSEALVNIRYTLQQAVKEQCINAQQADELICYASKLQYTGRSYWQLLTSPVVQNWNREDALRIEHYFRTHSLNLKMNDAIGLLRSCDTIVDVAQSSIDSQLLYQECKPWRPARFFLGGFYASWGVARGEEVVYKATQHPQLLEAMRTELSKRCFLLNWARQNHIGCPNSYIKTFIEKHEKVYGIDAKGTWLQANGLTSFLYKELLSERAVADWLIHQKPNYFGTRYDGLQGCKGVLLANQKVNFQCIDDIDNYSKEFPEADFIFDWAVKNGVSCPPEFIGEYSRGWELEYVSGNFVEWLNAKGLTFSQYWHLMSKRALVEWVIKQGPNYFGLFWNFELAMLNELQITGYAMQLMEEEQEVLC